MGYDRVISGLLGAAFLLGVLGGTAAAQPSAARPRLTTAFIKADTGVTLQYVEQGDRRGPVVMLLHGAGDSWHSWELVLPRLPATWHVFALTLRGHGLSDHPADGYTRREFAADVSAVLRQLDLRNVTLVGHSLGSFVAQVVAQDDREGRIVRLGLVGSGPGRPPAANAPPSALSAYFASVRDPIDYQFARDFQAGTAHTPLPAAFLETMIAEVQRVPAAMFHALARGDGDPEHIDKLRRIKARTLLFWGDKDAMFSRADQDDLLQIIPGSRLLAYPDTGHALHWEQPARFARDLAGFMAR